MAKNWDNMTIESKLDDLKAALEMLDKLRKQDNVNWNQRIGDLEAKLNIFLSQQKAL